MITQYYNGAALLGAIAFVDMSANVHSALCQPRDIQVLRFDLDAKQVRNLQQDIAVDIRIAQGVPVHKASKKLKFD